LTAVAAPDDLIGDAPLDSLAAPVGPDAALNRWQGFVQTAPAMPSAAAGPLALVNAGDNAAWFGHVHGQTEQVGPLGVHVLDDVTVSGCGIAVRAEAMLGDDSEPCEAARRLAEADGLRSAEAWRRLRRVVLLDPALLAAGPGYAMWGHWLLDILPRLAVARAALGAAEFAGCVLPVPQDTPDWAGGLIGEVFGLGPERLMRYDPHREAILCRRAIVPTYAHRDYFLHPFLRDFYRGLAAGAGATEGLPRRVLVSRRAFAAAHPQASHLLAQQDAFEQAAIRHGFAAMTPENMPLARQIALFAQAEAVAGVCGSGMHNALFCPPGTAVGQVGMPNARQSRIAAACGHRLVYLLPDSEGEEGMSVEPALFDALFAAMDHH
jgi:capsular polysaccharide biosynthesis protein